MLTVFDPDKRLLPRRRLIYISPVEWGSLWQRPQQIASRLSRRFDVCYVQPVGMRRLQLRDVARLFERRTAAPTANHPSQALRPRYLPFPGFALVDHVNKRWLLRQVQRSIGNDARPWVLWIGAPNLLAETLIERGDPELVVYDCMDRYGAFHGGRTRRRIERTEQAVVERADVVFATSQTLASRLRSLNSQVTLVPNGVDVDSFAGATPSSSVEWLSSLPRPIVGFHGTLGDWLDYPLLERLAKAHLGWSFVFLGPMKTRRAADLLTLKNVHHHPEVAYRDLPGYSAHFDAAMIPFQLNDLTESVHPIKALEYLALGLPVVSTPLPDLLSFHEVVRFARTDAEWSAELIAATRGESHAADQIAARRKAIESQSWDERDRLINRQMDAAWRRQVDAEPVDVSTQPQIARRAA